VVPIRCCSRAEALVPSLLEFGPFPVRVETRSSSFPIRLVPGSAPKDISFPLPSPQPDPPRCFVDLQCLTTRRSRSSGFPAPPMSFHLSAWTMTSSGERPLVGFPSSWPSLLAFRSPSRTSTASSSVPPGHHTIGCRSSRPSSLEVCCPFDAPNPGNLLPGRSFHASNEFVAFPLRPRRELPHSLRSVFVVFRDPDGLPLPGPCDLFQPLTPMGFGYPSPLLLSLPSRVLRPSFSGTPPPVLRSEDRVPFGVGGGFPCHRLPIGFHRRSACASRLRIPPLRPSRRPFRLRLPSAFTVLRCPPDHLDGLSCGVQSFPGVSFPFHPFQPSVLPGSEDPGVRDPPGRFPLRVYPCNLVCPSAVVLTTTPVIPTGDEPFRVRCAPDHSSLDIVVVRVFWLGLPLPCVLVLCRAEALRSFRTPAGFLPPAPRTRFNL